MRLLARTAVDWFVMQVSPMNVVAVNRFTYASRHSRPIWNLERAWLWPMVGHICMGWACMLLRMLLLSRKIPQGNIVCWHV